MLTFEEVNDLRQKVLRGESISDEEMAGAIQFLRGTREATKPEKKTKSKKEVPPLADTIDSLLGGQ